MGFRDAVLVPHGEPNSHSFKKLELSSWLLDWVSLHLPYPAGYFIAVSGAHRWLTQLYLDSTVYSTCHLFAPFSIFNFFPACNFTHLMNDVATNVSITTDNLFNLPQDAIEKLGLHCRLCLCHCALAVACNRWNLLLGSIIIPYKPCAGGPYLTRCYWYMHTPISPDVLHLYWKEVYHVALLAVTLLIMSSVGDMTVDSDSPPSCSHLSSSDEEVINSQSKLW